MLFLSRLNLWLAITLWSAGLAWTAPKFDRPHDYLGPTNFEGKVYAWFEIGALDLSDGTKLPFRLLFTSLPSKGSPLFGKFWWCPLLESTCLPVSETTYRLSTLGGRHVYLRKDKEGILSNGDGTWSGKFGPGENSLIISAPGDWTYFYQRGRLVRADHAQTLHLEWVYTNGRLMGIREAQSGSLVTLGYSGSDMLPTSLDLKNKRHDLSSQSIPNVVDVSGRPVVAGFEPSLSEIKSVEWWCKFPVTLEQTGDYHLKYSEALGANQRYVWQGVSGLLVSDEDWTYSIQKGSDNQPVVARKNKNGGMESYFYDSNTGASEHFLPNGLRIIKSYFTAIGPTQYQIRKTVTFWGTKEVKSTQWSYDELGRMIREKTGDLEKVLSYNSNGALESKIANYKDKLVSAEYFDLQGRLAKKTSRGTDYIYSYEEGKTTLQRIQNGKVALSLVSDSKTKQDFVFLPESDSGRLSPPEGTSYAVASAEDVEAAKAVAYRAMEKLKNEKTN